MDKKTVASGVSILLNAPLITLATFIPLILKFGGSFKGELFVITAFFGCVLPLIMVALMLKKGIISDFYATDRNERFIPFILTISSYIAGTISLLAINAPPAITALMACYIVNGIVILGITLKWKISIHASGVTSPVTALVYLLGTRMLPLFLFFIPVAWARLELKAHTKFQVTAGALISSILTWLQMAFYVNYIFI
jgi:membrane-associated phospholipid phosphatase